MSMKYNHPYHLVDQSPWPILASFSAMMITTGLSKWFHNLNYDLLLTGLMSTLMTSALWWRDISREGAMTGFHTIKVTTGLRWGMILFIVSEILFFFSFFWAFFHSSLNLTMELGMVWPPLAIKPFNPFSIPLLNTAILLASGVSITWAHHSMLENMDNNMLWGMLVTIFLGLYFTSLQVLEYYEASFTISDSVYGTTFFVATGFHGLHVIIGTTFLMMCLMRFIKGQFTSNHHMGLEAAIWYWHFVDVVWLFLYTWIYWWGS